MDVVNLYIISILNGAWAFIHFLIIPILSIIGAYYLFCYYAGFRLIEWTKEMELAKRKASIDELDEQVERIKQNMGEEKWQTYLKQQERFRQIESLLKEKMIKYKKS